MFNELYQKVVEHKLLTYFKENNFNSLDLDRILAEINRSTNLYGNFDLVKIIADVRSTKLVEQAPVVGTPAPAGQQQPAAAAPAAGTKPTTPAPAPAGQKPATGQQTDAQKKQLQANTLRIAKEVTRRLQALQKSRQSDLKQGEDLGKMIDQLTRDTQVLVS